MIVKSLVDELSEDREKDEKIIKSFYTKNSLSLDIFQQIGGSYKMIQPVRDRLLLVADKFIEFLGVEFFVDDVVLTGSLANYNWSEYSDVDLHIVIDYEESDFNNNTLLQEFFDAKKNVWNSTHDIKIKNYEVEIYVQDSKEKHISSGVYSILNDVWVVEPQKEKKMIDDKGILEKGEEYAKLIDALIEKKKKGQDVSDESNTIKKKLKRFRQTGLDKGGEFSYENLTFKLLRRNGYIEKLLNLKNEILNKSLSINESVNFSDRDILKIEKAAIQEYGITHSFTTAGYITPSGYLLDFGGGSGSRIHDHRNIGYVLQTSDVYVGEYEDSDKWKYSESWGMYVVLDMGFIRVVAEGKAIHMVRPPTQQQYEVLRDMINEWNSRIRIQINNDIFVDHEEGTPEDFIIEGIKRYFSYGERPKSYSDMDDEMI